MFKKVFSLHSRAGYDPFSGFGVHGVPRLVLSRGEVLARDDSC
jgi:dihydroorotase-like cyclic amidohydrolase